MTPAPPPVTFEEFRAGIDAGRIKYVVRGRLRSAQDYPLLRGAGGRVTYSLMALTYALPVIVIPLISYLNRRWLLMIGFLPLAFGLLVAQVAIGSTRPWREFVQMSLIQLLFVALLWYYTGFGVLTFCVICFLYAFFFCTLSSLLYYAFVTHALISDAEHFYRAVESGRITIHGNA